MSISGNLNTLELSELLQWLAQGTKTGTLEITAGEDERRLFFERGRIVGTQSNEPREHLGTLLVAEGLIDRPTLDHAMRLQVATRILLGKVLVTLGFLAEADLERVLRLKALETICELFRWPEGEFKFLRDELPQLDMVPLSLQVTDVLMEGLRRLDEERAGGEDRSVRAAEAPAEAPPAEPAPAEAAEAAAAGPEALEPEPPPAPADLASFAPPSGVAVAGLSATEAPGGLATPGRIAAAVGGLLALAGLGWAYLQPAERPAAARTFVAWEAPPAGQLLASVAPLPIDAPAEAPAGVEPPGPRPAEAGAAPRAEDLEVEVERLVAARSAEMEDSLRHRYEAEIARLRAEVSQARQLAAAGGRGPAAPSRSTSSPADGGPQEARPASSGPERSEPPTQRAAAGPGAAEALPAPQVPARAPASTGPPAARASTAVPTGDAPEKEAATATGGGAPGSGEAIPGAAQNGAPVAAEDSEPRIAAGAENLEVESARLLHMPTPRYPPAARRLQREATVAVRLRIDEAGEAVEAEIAGRRAGLGFDEAALEAARRSRWQPATRQGAAVPSWVTLSVEFRN